MFHIATSLSNVDKAGQFEQSFKVNTWPDGYKLAIIYYTWNQWSLKKRLPHTMNTAGMQITHSRNKEAVTKNNNMGKQNNYAVPKYIFV